VSATRPRLIVGISGASAPQLGEATLRALRELGTVETHLVLSRGARQTIEQELDLGLDGLLALADVVHEPQDLAAPISSGSFATLGMAVVPCSMGRLAAIANGSSDDLLARAADVCLKERRRLVLVTRETPLNLIHIRNMEAATLAGATILPPVLAFYHRPADVRDLVGQVVGRVLDQFGIEHRLFRRWGEA
jgi:polyprenyl P-hydroxybenzoate/phenylacrylic acid decarboxylase-like protein